MSSILTQMGSDADLNESLAQALYFKSFEAGDFLAVIGTSITTHIVAPVKTVVWNLTPSAQRVIVATFEVPSWWVRGKLRYRLHYTGSAVHASQVINHIARVSLYGVGTVITATADSEEVDTTLAVPAASTRARMTPFVHVFDLEVNAGHTDGSLALERVTTKDTYAGNFLVSRATLEYLPARE